jgi:serine/threonine protein kinase
LTKEDERALTRFKGEVEALKVIDHPSVLRLLHANIDSRFMITQYHRRKSLKQNLTLCKGDALAALKAFRPLVEAVIEIHQHKMIHRDIKPLNIFVADSGQLVLGDFGIVFFHEEEQRPTETDERVGSHEWMAAWAYKNEKLDTEQVNPSLDTYPLAKVLWSMIAGRNGFPYWDPERSEYDLKLLFPESKAEMTAVNVLLKECIQRDERDCQITTGQALLDGVDELTKEIRLIRRGERPPGAVMWACRSCGNGHYRAAIHSQPGGKFPYKVDATVIAPGRNIIDTAKFDVYRCDNCGHVELFAPRFSE